ncbi:major facilitator superfamily domain-containing protein [Crassisporium funariophilum]|nr:major facilitator superfamily domain-containing protein [Crassisporium funariophilum]
MRISGSDGAFNEDSSTDPDPELKLPKRSSLLIIVFANVLLQLSFFIIVSTSNGYSEHLGGTSTFSGLVIGIPTVFSGLALIPLIKLDGGGYRLPLHLSCGAMIVGHILYAIAYRVDFLYLILIGRMVNGLGFTMWMYCKRYCSDPRIVGIRRRTTLASLLVLGQGVGMSLGPFAGGLLYKIGFGNAVFNGYTSQAWIMAALWVVFWICVGKWYEDVPQDISAIGTTSLYSQQSQKEKGDDSKSITATRTPSPELPAPETEFIMTYAQWGVVFCMCWFAMASFFVLGAWEANLPVFGADTPVFHWSPFAAGNFIALGGITAFPFLLLNSFLARRVEDRKILAFGSSLGFAGLIIMLSLLETDNINYGTLWVCWWAVALGFNLGSSVTVSVLSKQLPPSWNGRNALAVQYSMYSGRVTGAVLGGSGVRMGMMNYVGLEIAIIGIGAVVLTILWRNLKTKMG